LVRRSGVGGACYRKLSQGYRSERADNYRGVATIAAIAGVQAGKSAGERVWHCGWTV
jgi:hypothetical protein